MKKIISFDKELEFNSIVGDISSISLDHNLKLSDNNIIGELIVSGSYRITEASRLEDNFEFKIPVEIIINEELEPDSVIIEIEDFKYSVQNNDTLVCNIEIKLEGVEVVNLEEKEVLVRNNEERECDDDIKEEKYDDDIKNIEISEEATEEETIDEEENNISDDSNVSSIFSSLEDSEETFSTYSIYIMQQNDSIENILDKYKITKEELENYNDLSSITSGSKIIIPSNYEND
ncbi:MAG: LysM peptidoglycan-binding domain-containing protein [Bacilli bacterium]|nr:LysM peptidoglycan-binding domain-containing protein [Bacilli bacterium]